MSEFYLTLLSNSSRDYFKENTIAHFWTRLPQRINLEGDNWKVGLMEFSYPKIIDKKVEDSERGTRGKRNVIITLPDGTPIKIAPGIYNSMKAMIDSIPTAKRKRAIHSLSEYISHSCDEVLIEIPGDSPATIPPGTYRSLEDMLKSIPINKKQILSICDGNNTEKLFDSVLDSKSIMNVELGMRVTLGESMIKEMNELINVQIMIPSDTMLRAPPPGKYESLLQFVINMNSQDLQVRIDDIILQLFHFIYSCINNDKLQELNKREKFANVYIGVSENSPLRALPNSYATINDLMVYVLENMNDEIYGERMIKALDKLIVFHIDIPSNELLGDFPTGTYNSLMDLMQAIDKSRKKIDFLPTDAKDSLRELITKIREIFQENHDSWLDINKVSEREHYRDRMKRSIISDDTNSRYIFVYTDIIKPQLIGDSLSRCIRIVRANEDEQHFFNPPYYVSIEKREIEIIEIMLAGKDGERIPFRDSSKPSVLVLHFIKTS